MRLPFYLMFTPKGETLAVIYPWAKDILGILPEEVADLLIERIGEPTEGGYVNTGRPINERRLFLLWSHQNLPPKIQVILRAMEKIPIMDTTVVVENIIQELKLGNIERLKQTKS